MRVKPGLETRDNFLPASRCTDQGTNKISILDNIVKLHSNSCFASHDTLLQCRIITGYLDRQSDSSVQTSNLIRNLVTERLNLGICPERGANTSRYMFFRPGVETACGYACADN